MDVLLFVNILKSSLAKTFFIVFDEITSLSPPSEISEKDFFYSIWTRQLYPLLTSCFLYCTGKAPYFYFACNSLRTTNFHASPGRAFSIVFPSLNQEHISEILKQLFHLEVKSLDEWSELLLKPTAGVPRLLTYACMLLKDQKYLETGKLDASPSESFGDDLLKHLIRKAQANLELNIFSEEERKCKIMDSLASSLLSVPIPIGNFSSSNNKGEHGLEVISNLNLCIGHVRRERSNQFCFPELVLKYILPKLTNEDT
jgi:hypothetical protein